MRLPRSERSTHKQRSSQASQQPCNKVPGAIQMRHQDEQHQAKRERAASKTDQVVVSAAHGSSLD